MFPVGLVLTMGGTLLVWSAVKDENPWDTLRGVLTGGTGDSGATVTKAPESPRVTPGGIRGAVGPGARGPQGSGSSAGEGGGIRGAVGPGARSRLPFPGER